MKKKRINKILKNLEIGYDLIADKFSGTRNFFWPDLEFIQGYVKNDDRVLDFGCGNGRLLEILKNKAITYVGTDISQNLIELAKAKYPQRQNDFIKLSGQSILPFNNNYFNVVFSIAVFHHFPRDYAQIMAREIYRITAPNGKLIITCWNLKQKKYWRKLFNLKLILQKIFHTKEAKNLGWKDVYIDFKNNKGEIFQRFHHFYSLKELQKIFSSVGFSIEKCFIKEGKNIILIAQK